MMKFIIGLMADVHIAMTFHQEKKLDDQAKISKGLHCLHGDNHVQWDYISCHNNRDMLMLKADEVQEIQVV
jgi:hypothetical protein